MTEGSPGSGAVFNRGDEYSSNGYLLLPIRDGYLIKEWNTRPDGGGTSYEDRRGGYIGTFKEDTTLYVIWKCKNHSGDWKVIREATELSTGQQTRKCSVCGETETN